MESLRVTIQISFKDFLNFQFNHLRKRMMPFLVFFILMFIVSLYSILYWGAELTEWILPIAPFLVSPLVFFGVIYFSAKKSFNSDPFLKKEHIYTFSKEKFKVTNENSDLNIDWKDVYRYVFTKHSLLIYVSSQKALILPKRFFQDDEQSFLLSVLKSEVTQKKDYSILIRIAIYATVVIAVLFYSGVFSPTPIDYLKKAYDEERKGNFKEAIEYFNKAIEENPKMAEAYLHRGYSKGQIGDNKGYLEDCNMALKLNTSYVEAYSNRAFAKYQLGDSTGACKDLQKAISLGDKKAEIAFAEHCK